MTGKTGSDKRPGKSMPNPEARGSINGNLGAGRGGGAHCARAHTHSHTLVADEGCRGYMGTVVEGGGGGVMSDADFWALDESRVLSGEHYLTRE